MSRRLLSSRRLSSTNPATRSFESLESRRLLSASSLDTSFHGTGIATASGVPGDSEFTATAVMDDGRIVAAGYTQIGENVHFLVARFTANGSLDTSFGSGHGYVMTRLSGAGGVDVDEAANGVALLPGGKIAVVGSSDDTPDHHLVMMAVRYNANGSLDTSFSGDGKLGIDLDVFDSNRAYAVAPTSDGKLVIAGSTNSDQKIALVRLNNNGSFDSSFSGDGKVVTNLGMTLAYADSLAILPSGRILVGGSAVRTSDGLKSSYMLAQFTSSGSLDTSFNGTGFKVVRQSAGDGLELITSIAVLNSGKIVAGGFKHGPGTNDPDDFALMRFNASGSVDTSFGVGGFRIGGMGSSTVSAQMYKVVAQPDGKLLGIGFVITETSSLKLAIARYTSNGAFDTSFSGDGKLTLNGLGAGGAAYLGGKYIAVGFVVTHSGGFTDSAAAVFRFGADAAATAKISGTVYNDLNNNGSRQSGEPAMAGVQVFADYNNDGFYTVGEKVATTNSSGNYTLSGLAPGTYRIREVRPSSYNRTQPAGAYPLGYYDVTLSVGLAVSGRNFGNHHI